MDLLVFQSSVAHSLVEQDSLDVFLNRVPKLS